MKRYIKSDEDDELRYLVEYSGKEYYIQYDMIDDIYDVCRIDSDEVIDSFYDIDEAIEWIDMMEK